MARAINTFAFIVLLRSVRKASGKPISATVPPSGRCRLVWRRFFGQKLIDLCRNGRNLEAIDQLYSRDIVSVEATGSPEMPRERRGIDQIRGKNQWWYDNKEVHSGNVEGPFPNQDRFSVIFQYETTPKNGPAKGKRMSFREVGVTR